MFAQSPKTRLLGGRTLDGTKSAKASVGEFLVLFAEKSTWRNLQKNSWNQKNRIHFPSKDTKNKNSGTKAVVHRLNNYLYIGEFKL